MAISSAATLFPIAVLDKLGYIVGVNQAWKDFGERNGVSKGYTAVGKNYVTISQQAGDEYGDRAAAELRRLLNDEQTEFTVVYPCHSPNQERWVRLYATTVSVDDDRYHLLIHQHLNQDSLSRGNVPSKVRETPTGNVSYRNRSRLVTYNLPSDESATDGLLIAFDAIGIDKRHKDTTLHDEMDTDAINALQTNMSEFHITFRVWNYPVSLTPEKVIIYTPEHSSD